MYLFITAARSRRLARGYPGAAAGAGFSVMSWAGRELSVCHHMPWALFVALDLHLAALPGSGRRAVIKTGLIRVSPPRPPCYAWHSPPLAQRPGYAGRTLTCTR